MLKVIIPQFIKRHKILSVFIAISIGIILAVIITLQVLSPYYAVGCTTFSSEGYDTFSITFDKQDMMRVNRVEFKAPDGITVIDDKDLVSDIVDATLVAKHSAFSASFGDFSIQLYVDDVLIRDMDLSIYNNCIRVYYPDKTHFFLYGGEEGGYVTVSDEFLLRFHQYLKKYGKGLNQGSIEVAIFN